MYVTQVEKKLVVDEQFRPEARNSIQSVELVIISISTKCLLQHWFTNVTSHFYSLFKDNEIF